MNTATPIPSIFDTQSLTALKGDLRKANPQALKSAAQQFEAVFLQMVLKSMRAAAPQESMFDSDQSRFYQDLLDSQLSQVMSAKGGTGLAAMIERQLSRTDAAVAPSNEGGIPLTPPTRALPLDQWQRSIPLPDTKVTPALRLDGSPVRPATPIQPPIPSVPSDAQTFTANVLPYAVSASQQTGIPAHFLVAHAALESGWGRSEPRFANGSPSYNLFGIKAGSNWQGAVVEATTTEYVNGIAERRVERFRAYGSYAEAFNDYARLLSTQPRYAQVLGVSDAASFARGLQSAGYATDPAYADKLVRVIGSPALKIAG